MNFIKTTSTSLDITWIIMILLLKINEQIMREEHYCSEHNRFGQIQNIRQNWTWPENVMLFWIIFDCYYHIFISGRQPRHQAMS